ncbi:MAG: hypothetical protein ACI4EV_02690 [Lachnospiraceae bacterium]
MAKANVKKTAAIMLGFFVAILFWVFCITFTVTVISGQNRQIADNNVNRETVTVYIEPDSGALSGIDSQGQQEQTQADTQKETTNLDKYYMIDKAGNYVKGTLPYGDK